MPTKNSPPSSQIRKAIRDKRIVTFSYAGMERRCETHVFGVANGREQVLCWQLEGSSRRGGLPFWRRFDLADMSKFEITKETFPDKRPVPHPYSIWDEVILHV